MSSSAHVLVLGHRGMLGRVVVSVLREEGCHVSTTDARDPHENLVEEVARSTASAVVNCIGARPRSSAGVAELFSTNSLLPQRIAAALGRNRLLIHASSDGVFDGRRGGYRSDEEPDALDPYGLSKRLGELAVHLGRVAVIRCSIIGLEAGAPRSLLGWFLAQTDRVTGYTDHLWNGVTTLTWARIAARILRGDIGTGIHQPACAAPITKHALLTIAGRVFERHLPVEPALSGSPVDRTLIPDIPCSSIDDQIVELRDWHRDATNHANFHSSSHV